MPEITDMCDDLYKNVSARLRRIAEKYKDNLPKLAALAVSLAETYPCLLSGVKEEVFLACFFYVTRQEDASTAAAKIVTILKQYALLLEVAAEPTSE